MPPKKDKKDKKDKKPRKPRAKKEKKVTQKQTQTQIVNVHLGGRGKPRAKSAPKVSQIPQTFIRMNEPAIPLPIQPIPPMREPLKERTAPSRLVGMLPTADNLSQAMFQGIAEAEAEAKGYDIAEATPIRRGRPSLDPAVLKQRKEQAEMERERKRKEKEQRRTERELNAPLPRPRGRPKKSGEGAGSKMAAETDSGYEN